MKEDTKRKSSENLGAVYGIGKEPKKKGAGVWEENCPDKMKSMGAD